MVKKSPSMKQWGVGGGEECRKASGLAQEAKKPPSLVKGSQTTLPAPGPFIAPTGIHSAPSEALWRPQDDSAGPALEKRRIRLRPGMEEGLLLLLSSLFFKSSQ